MTPPLCCSDQKQPVRYTSRALAGVGTCIRGDRQDRRPPVVKREARPGVERAKGRRVNRERKERESRLGPPARARFSAIFCWNAVVFPVT